MAYVRCLSICLYASSHGPLACCQGTLIVLYDSDERAEYMSAASAASLLNERGYANV